MHEGKSKVFLVAEGGAPERALTLPFLLGNEHIDPPSFHAPSVLDITWILCTHISSGGLKAMLTLRLFSP